MMSSQHFWLKIKHMLISPLLCNNYRKQVLPVLVKANIFYHMIVRNIYIIVFTPEYAQHGT